MQKFSRIRSKLTGLAFVPIRYFFMICFFMISELTIFEIFHITKSAFIRTYLKMNIQMIWDNIIFSSSFIRTKEATFNVIIMQFEMSDKYIFSDKWFFAASSVTFELVVSSNFSQSFSAMILQMSLLLFYLYIYFHMFVRKVLFIGSFVHSKNLHGICLKFAVVAFVAICYNFMNLFFIKG